MVNDSKFTTNLWESCPSSKNKRESCCYYYDDGPVPGFTDDILYVLQKHDVKATFFVIGQRAEKNPDLIKKIYTQGHEIGNHSWSYKMLVCQSKRFIKGQIEKTDEVLREYGYKGNVHFRSPHGIKFVVLPRILSKQKRKKYSF